MPVGEMMAWAVYELDSKIDGTRFTWRDALSLRRTGSLANPTDEQRANIIKQAHALEPIYDLIGGFNITSWLRPADYNRLIGGAPHSAHLSGLATDFVPLHLSPDDARAKIKAAGIYPGRTELNAKTWCHYDLTGTEDFIA
jgi:hypothetical protein